MMDDEKFDSLIEDINYDLFWHKMEKDHEAHAYLHATPTANILRFYDYHLRMNDPLLERLSPVGERTITVCRKIMVAHSSGRLPTRAVTVCLNRWAASIAPAYPGPILSARKGPYLEQMDFFTLSPGDHYVADHLRCFRKIFYAQPKPILPKPIPRPTLARLQELRERKEGEEADRNFHELLHAEDALEAARNRKKRRCKRKSKAQRRKPPPYGLDVPDGEEIMMDASPPPAYTPD